MCLILFAYRQRDDYPLILIANRDEYYARPTRCAHWWPHAAVLAGRDLEAGGSWLGVSRGGRLAAVTNVREAGGMRAGKRSRGELTRDFLCESVAAAAYLETVAVRAQDYAGFNLLFGDLDELWFYTNRGNTAQRVAPGVYGISNGSFDEPWPKLSSGKAELAGLLDGDLDSNKLMAILTDHRIAEDHLLPSTGIALDVERLLSSRFIRSPDYGTRACTVLLIGADGRVAFSEQNFGVHGKPAELVEEAFSIEG